MKPLRIGTRDSQLALWQATLVSDLLQKEGLATEIVHIKSEGDLDTVTPLYALGVTGVFTKALDAALLNNRIDIAVHSMKDVPTQLAQGIREAAVLKRASTKDILVYKDEADLERLGFRGGKWTRNEEGKTTEFSAAVSIQEEPFTVATGSVRRIAQWLNRYPGHYTTNLRGNVNTRLRKLAEHDWNGAIFAAAGLERIELRPKQSVDLDWMLPAPAQGAIMIVCREDDKRSIDACAPLNDEVTAFCTRVEREFLSALMGGCSTPISALAEPMEDGSIRFRGNIVSPDGKTKIDTEAAIGFAKGWEYKIPKDNNFGASMAASIIKRGGQQIIDGIRKGGLAADEEA